ncbi:hypothetical protein AYI68_g7070 [Smittium mucronatum]|uniref:Retrotransposon gag domain-containing protein n=1 Tax=Smittium mucronatum TaxID=133383 RepID=A0A1R0GPQ3_9FUNG|nr:hypothetical protein AYI68_g7070 [Smittium mucronatum]
MYFWKKQKIFNVDRHISIFIPIHRIGPEVIWFSSLIISKSEIIRSYGLFSKEFKKNFSDHSHAIGALRMIMKSRQGPRSVATYAAEFHNLRRYTG